MFCTNLTRSFGYLNISPAFEHKSGLFYPLCHHPLCYSNPIPKKIEEWAMLLVPSWHISYLRSSFSTMLQKKTPLDTALSSLLRTQAGFKAGEKTWKEICVPKNQFRPGIFANLSSGGLIMALVLLCGVKPQHRRLESSTGLDDPIRMQPLYKALFIC